MHRVNRSEQYKNTIREHQLRKGDFWELYKFKRRFTPEAVPEDISFWEFKKEITLFLKDPAASKYADLFLALSNELTIIKSEHVPTRGEK